MFFSLKKCYICGKNKFGVCRRQFVAKNIGNILSKEEFCRRCWKSTERSLEKIGHLKKEL